MTILQVNSRLHVPLAEIEFTYTRSSGPGGQNVNKVNSKVTLRWNPARNTSLPMPVRDRFLERYRSRLTTAGDLIVTSQRYRDQGRNVDDCLEKLRLMIATVAVAPVKRKKTRPSRASVERRLDEKRAVSQKKQRRRSDS